MQSFNIQNDQIHLSPNKFFLRPPEPDFPLQELLPASDPEEQGTFKEDFDQGAKTSSKEEKKRLAGVRSREKKKKYVESLEDNVKQLTGEIEKFDLQISKCKDQLVEAIKTSSQNSNEHAYTFGELEKNLISEDPDIDLINLLLDLVQNRIGANARERQANLDYTFKQIINSMFPAMHRYLMYAALNQQDVFNFQLHSEELQQSSSKWTQELYRNSKLRDDQLEVMRKYGPEMKKKRGETVEVIKKLKKIKGELKMQEEIFEQKIMEFREDLNPIQAGLMAVFGEKNKLRRQFSLGIEFEEVSRPRKIIKRE